MRKLYFFFLLTTSFSFAQTQFEDISNVAEDLVFLAEQFISPAARGAVYQSSGGWYTNADAKELWDIEFSVQGNALIIPNKFNSFFVDETTLKNLRVKGDETQAFLPTALGNDDFVAIEGSIGNDIFEFDSPEGISDSSIQHAQLQLALGLWKGTALILRYSPEIKIKDARFNLQGFGIQHSISQWIPKFTDSGYNLAVSGNYSNYNVGDRFTEVDLTLGTLNSILVDGETYSFNIIGSKTINNFDFSLALGGAVSDFEYTVGGEGRLVLEILNQALEDLDGSDFAFKSDIGVNYNLKQFSFNTMLTFGTFANVLFGINYNL